MTFPPWKEMSPEQKFEFLHQWCLNLSAAVERLGNQTQALHERLRVVEEKLGKTQ